jgi:hypothetical protein
MEQRVAYQARASGPLFGDGLPGEGGRREHPESPAGGLAGTGHRQGQLCRMREREALVSSQGQPGHRYCHENAFGRRLPRRRCAEERRTSPAQVMDRQACLLARQRMDWRPDQRGLCNTEEDIKARSPGVLARMQACLAPPIDAAKRRRSSLVQRQAMRPPARPAHLEVVKKPMGYGRCAGA